MRSLPEAYFVLWLQQGGANQLFTWEHPHDLLDGPVLGAPGLTSHANYGHRPGDYGRDAFLAAVTALTGIPLRVIEEAPTPGVIPRSALQQHREIRTPMTIARDVFLGLVGVLFVVICAGAIYGSCLR